MRKAVSPGYDLPSEIPIDIGGMWEKTQAMLRDSLDALVRLDAKLAHQVCTRDNEVDQMKHEFRLEIEKRICRDPGRAPWLLRLMAATRNLERIADCATNIAEDVIYLIEGKIVRHEKKE